MSFLDDEAEIITRIATEIGSDARIYSGDELAGIEERQQKTPAVHVLYDGYRPTQSLGGGNVQEIAHDWIMVVAVRNARQGSKDAGKALRDEAAPLLNKVLRSCMGFRCTGSSPLKMIAAPKPYYSDGFAYFPLAYENKTHHRSTN